MANLVQELNGFKIDQVVSVEIDGEWDSGPIRTLLDDQGGWAEINLSMYGLEFLPLRCLRLIPSDEPAATSRQMAYLKDLGYEGVAISKSEASQKINELKSWKNAAGACHYCGAPAQNFGFFGELACGQCGGG